MTSVIFISCERNDITGSFQSIESLGNSARIEYNMELLSDSTFVFEVYNFQVCYEETKLYKGSWTMHDSKISFGNAVDVYDNKNDSDMDGATATVNGDSMTIYTPNVYWMQNKVLIKTKK
ncbi:MAG: hypothetical protein H6600_02235 [Flavobacteriales bacterium]|nr:hypothetical protein [Flavobacteriales bacterium]